MQTDSKASTPVSGRRIAQQFAPYRWRLALVGSLVGCTAAVSLVYPFLVREIIDVALPENRRGLLTVLALAMIAVSIARGLLSVWQIYASTQVGQFVMHDLRTRVYTHLQRQSLRFFIDTPAGELQSRIANDIGGMQDTVTTVGTTMVSNFAMIVAVVIAMFALDWRLALASMIMMPVFIVVARNVGGERRRITARKQRQLASMSAIVEESLSVSGFLLGRTMGRSDSLTAAFAEESRKLTWLEVQANTSGRWRQSSAQIVMSCIPAGIYWVTGLSAADGASTISIGTLVAFTTLQASLFGPSIQFLDVSLQMNSSLELFGRVFECLDLPLEIRESEQAVRPATFRGDLQFDAVEFSYAGSESSWKLVGVDLSVSAGRSLAIVGESGSGKTTLGYLIPRLYDVTSGAILIDGVDVRQLAFESLAAAVGVVSQDAYVFYGTVADNLRFAKPDATDEELMSAASAAQIHDDIVALDAGYDTMVGQRGHRFSGGETQRLALARVILRDPPILVLDEATSALDTQTERAVQQAIAQLSAGRTTITIAHRLSTIRDCDEIVVMASGAIVERGTHEELLARGGRYASLVNRDAKAVAA